jgi:SAM-dependent methyltransferase
MSQLKHKLKSFLDYRGFIRAHYDGPAGALTGVTGYLTGHETLAGRLIRSDGFDVRGCHRLLDAGCGNGRYSRLLLRDADPGARVFACDLSSRMLKRARKRLNDDRVSFTVADLTRLPYADASFDAAVCGWVIEHLPDPRHGLRELARVLAPGGKLLLLTTENTFAGRWCGRLWHCRTYDRPELRAAAAECGLEWGREMYFSRLHARLGIGGIIVELHRTL